MDNSNPYTFPHHPLLIIISGPAGVGKDSLVEQLKRIDMPFYFVITATDRTPRPNEIHGVDYFFYTTQEFLQMEEEGELLEHAIVYGQHKGVPKQQVRKAMASGQDAIMRVDVQGAATIRAIAPQAVSIFLAPSSEQELIQRLQQRKTDTPQQLEIRIRRAREEMLLVQEFDYVVINRQGKLDQAAAQVKAIIEAEHCRTNPRVLEL